MLPDRITVLGGNGFIGSRLCDRLSHLEYEYWSPARDDDAIYMQNLGHVIYAIGLTADFRQRPLDTVKAHVCVLENIIRRAAFISLTYLSSTRVYAGASSTLESAPLIVNPGQPDDLYNLSKLMGESLCLSCGHPGMKVARLSNIVGLRPDRDIFIDQLLEEGFETGRILIRTSADSGKDYLHVDDAVDAIIQIATGSAAGIFNVASGENVTHREVAKAISDQLGIPVTFADSAPTSAFPVINIERLSRSIDFLPKRFSSFLPEYLHQFQAAHLNKRQGTPATPPTDTTETL